MICQNKDCESVFIWSVWFLDPEDLDAILPFCPTCGTQQERFGHRSTKEHFGDQITDSIDRFGEEILAMLLVKVLKLPDPE